MSQVFHLPTRIFSGPDCVAAHAEAFRGLGTRALIVTGRTSALATGAGPEVQRALESVGLTWVLFDRVPPNPGFAEVREAAALARAEGTDFVIGIGGGSPLDAAKAVAILATNLLDDDALLAPPFPQAPLPVAAVPTTAGTGSEVTPYAILTNHKVQSKSNIAHESIFPRLAFLDARYTAGLPRNVTVNTALDALSHLVEGYLAVRSTPLSQVLALQGLGLLGPVLKGLASHRDLPTPEQRDVLLLASTTAGMVIAHTGTTVGHALGYSLTYFRNIDHGRANALVMAACLDVLMADHGPRVRKVLGALGFTAVSELRELLDSLLGPKEVLSDAEVVQFAGVAAKARNLANTLARLSEFDLAALYRRSLPC